MRFIRTEDSEGLPVESDTISCYRSTSSSIDTDNLGLVSLHQLTCPLKVGAHILHLDAHGWNSIRAISHQVSVISKATGARKFEVICSWAASITKSDESVDRINH